jgi:NTE family protein
MSDAAAQRHVARRRRLLRVLDGHGSTAERDGQLSPSLALVLSGGNALGAYQAGAYEALHESGREPDWLVGGSTGAINAAIIAGNRPEDRLARLRSYWQVEAAAAVTSDSGLRRMGSALQRSWLGQPNTFIPRFLLPWWPAPGAAPSLYDTQPLARTLEKIVDFDLANAGHPRLTVNAVDLESGDDVVFDSLEAPIRSEHVRASGGLLPFFPPVEIGGRLLGDAGLSANLPLSIVLSAPGDGDLLCIAVDVMPPAAPRPRSLDDSAQRQLDLIFASQSRHALQAWTAAYDLRRRLAAATDGAAAPRVTLVHLIYGGQREETAGKMFDYSVETVSRRWRAGHDDMRDVLRRIAAGALTPSADSGLTVHRILGAR